MWSPSKKNFLNGVKPLSTNICIREDKIFFAHMSVKAYWLKALADMSTSFWTVSLIQPMTKFPAVFSNRF